MGSEEADAGRKILLLAILCLFTVVILIVYTKFLLSRHQRRRSPSLQRQRWQVTVDLAELPKSGLDPSVIAGLPAFSYDGAGEPIECAVCLGAVIEGASVRVLPNCKHLFHVECVDTWLGSHTTCPICRARVEAVIEPSLDSEMGRAQPTAPPLDREAVGGGGGGGEAQLEKGGVSSSSSRLDSLRRIFGRSGGGDEVGTDDVERQ